jgi:fructan beta-fructosidase
MNDSKMNFLGRQNFILVILLSIVMIGCTKNAEKVVPPAVDSVYGESHRPLLHFSPKEKWMNDPNGMVYYKKNYHLFYQFYPDSTVWGPMHWGHAISKDLIHWEHLPIAIYPDSLGLIFSGSAVVDKDNTSGLGTKENPPLVALYTYHSVEKEKAGKIDYQTQGLAYSNDDGMTWKKYDRNPVLRNPGIKDFRDPKVFWHAESKKWIMSLAVQDHIEFYGSQNLIQWKKFGEFGKDKGAHGGVWECPDLFELPVEGSDETHWVLLVSINPGGPNGGSATQYFVGDFDGSKFRQTHNMNDTTWIDYGPDNYAGVTWSNAPDKRKLFMGWMNNWNYGNVVPTERWRGATTIPRELALAKSGLKRYVVSRPVPELKRFANAENKDNTVATDSIKSALSIIEGEFATETFDYIEFSNIKGEKLRIGLQKEDNRFYIDRSNAGGNSFSKSFVSKVYSPRLGNGEKIPFTIIMDVASVEVFFDNGLSVMTATFFPAEPLSKVMIFGTGDIHDASTSKTTFLKKIW